MDARTRVAWHLRKIRVEQGLSQEALGVDADVDRGYISGIERQTYNPTLDVLDRLAAALSIDVSQLLIEPNPDAVTPQPLRSGRRRTR